MIILVEGIDNAGKTLFINEIVYYLKNVRKVKKSNIQIYHLSKLNKYGDINKLYRNLYDILEDYSKNRKDEYFILDRAVISNFVYFLAFSNSQELVDYSNAFNFFSLVDKTIICHIGNKKLWEDKYKTNILNGKKELFGQLLIDSRTYELFDLIVKKDFLQLGKLVNELNPYKNNDNMYLSWEQKKLNIIQIENLIKDLRNNNKIISYDYTQQAFLIDSIFSRK